MNAYHEYECPVCQSPVTVSDERWLGQVDCLECNIALNLNRDGEFLHGQWIDMTTLTVQKPISSSNVAGG